MRRQSFWRKVTLTTAAHSQATEMPYQDAAPGGTRDAGNARSKIGFMDRIRVARNDGCRRFSPSDAQLVIRPQGRARQCLRAVYASAFSRASCVVSIEGPRRPRRGLSLNPRQQAFSTTSGTKDKTRHRALHFEELACRVCMISLMDMIVARYEMGWPRAYLCSPQSHRWHLRVASNARLDASHLFQRDVRIIDRIWLFVIFPSPTRWNSALASNISRTCTASSLRDSFVSEKAMLIAVATRYGPS